MELLTGFIDIVLHLDQHLRELVANYGPWIYAILFAIIFCETGLIVTPFLPGDSLLFVGGTLAATGSLYVHGLFATLAAASFLGDNCNYWIGRYAGPRVFSREGSRLLNPAHLERTQHFYDRYGAKTVFFARFVPIIRTFAPFVAGVGKIKTIAQLVALVVLLYQKDLDGLGLFHVGEVLLAFAAVLISAPAMLGAQQPYKVIDQWKIGGEGGWESGAGCEQGCAGDDAVAMGVEDAAVDAFGPGEVVGVDDEVFHGRSG